MPTTNQTSSDQLQALRAAAGDQHDGVFITGPNTVEVRSDALPSEAFDDAHVVTASLANCRCTSDAKAIRQFTQHARVPGDAEAIALGHETLQVVVHAPADTGLEPGQLVFITPGHASQRVNPTTFERDDTNGILPSLGYSYRYAGGLRPFSTLPTSAIATVRDQGFGRLYTPVPSHPGVSIASLAHAEPYACNAGTNRHTFTVAGREFRYGIPAGCHLVYLGGTARMAMINLTIVAGVPDDQLPRAVTITGSQRKLTELEQFALITDLRARGVTVQLIDRNASDLVAQTLAAGPAEVVFTNYASQAVYDQAAQLIAAGGNLNSYAGAADESLVIPMAIAASQGDDDPATQIAAMHHPIGANAAERQWGLASDGRVLLVGFTPDRADAYRAACGSTPVDVAPDLGPYTDVFIAGTGDEAAKRYAAIEPLLARGAAVNLVDGACTIAINSRRAHYQTRHQICGSNVPFHLTNTSEPHADDMGDHARKPIDFDWMVRGVCGLRAVPDMLKRVDAEQPFGSYVAYVGLPDLPDIDVEAEALRSAGYPKTADAVAANHGSWCRAAEEALYAEYGAPYPL